MGFYGEDTREALEMGKIPQTQATDQENMQGIKKPEGFHWGL